jgi:hypothetical protein
MRTSGHRAETIIRFAIRDRVTGSPADPPRPEH